MQDFKSPQHYDAVWLHACLRGETVSCTACRLTTPGGCLHCSHLCSCLMKARKCNCTSVTTPACLEWRNKVWMLRSACCAALASLIAYMPALDASQTGQLGIVLTAGSCRTMQRRQKQCASARLLRQLWRPPGRSSGLARACTQIQPSSQEHHQPDGLSMTFQTSNRS